MKSRLFASLLCIIASLVSMDVKAAESDLPLVNHAYYLHLMTNAVTEVWVRQKPDGGILAMAGEPNAAYLAEGDDAHRPIRYSSAMGRPLSNKMHFRIEPGQVRQLLEFSGDEASKVYRTEPEALFDPNTRPDPYLMANILLRHFNLKPGESREFTMCDWGNAGDKQDDFPSYKIRVEHKGKEQVTVPAGTFEANHVVQTQLTSADTWFKKRQEHVTDFWYLDDYLIIRILRHREPYEVVLQSRGEPTSASTQGAQSQESYEELFDQITRRTFHPFEGRVIDNMAGASEEKWQALEQNPFMQAFENIFGVSGARVVLLGDSVTTTTLTGDNGAFNFAKLPEGAYQLVVIFPANADGKEQIRRRRLSLPQERPFQMEIRWPNITIEGQVVDPTGKPIAGAKVTGSPDPQPEAAEPLLQSPKSAVTDNEGKFRLQDIQPEQSLYRIAGYLNGGDLSANFNYGAFFEFQVEAQGYVQKERPKVPLIVEDQLKPARRLWQAVNKAQRAENPGDAEIPTQMRALDYQTQGKTITGLRIVLHPDGGTALDGR